MDQAGVGKTTPAKPTATRMNSHLLPDLIEEELPERGRQDEAVLRLGSRNGRTGARGSAQSDLRVEESVEILSRIVRVLRSPMEHSVPGTQYQYWSWVLGTRYCLISSDRESIHIPPTTPALHGLLCWFDVAMKFRKRMPRVLKIGKRLQPDSSRAGERGEKNPSPPEDQDS